MFKTNMPKLIYATTGAIWLMLLPAAAFAGHDQSSKVYAPFPCTVDVDCDVTGQASLVRDWTGVELHLLTTGTDASALYTAWWVIFNKPAHCAVPHQCAGPDLSNPAVKGVVRWAAGGASTSDGVLALSGRLRRGDISGDTPPPFDGSMIGLGNPFRAEIHIVLRTHQGAISGSEYDQLFMYLGGCTINTCSDQQFAVFP